jgi:hypothetical protein
MRRPPLLGALVAVLCAGLLAACTAQPAVTSGASGGGGMASPRPAPPSPSPSPHPAPEPFEVVLEHIEMTSTSNAEIVGAGAPAPDHAQVELAVDRARRVLERYLDAQFLTEGTRFGAPAVHDLLTPAAQAALSDADRRGLGILPLPVDRVTSGPASARADVIFDGAEVQLVTLTFDAELKVGFDGRVPRLPVRQAGSLVYVPTEAGWRVAAADVTLDTPAPPTPRGAQ